MQDKSRFSPYLKSGNAVIGRDDQGLADNSDWSALYLWEHGQLVEEHAPSFRGSLAPRTRIPAHTGLLNTRLICHLPLIVPPHCGALRVGNEVRPWVEGELLIFDDSIEHEAWNDIDRDRVVLLFEIWRPEITAEERAMISALLTAVKE